MLGPEIARVDAPEALRLERRPHRDKLRQVVAQRSQPVMDPGADRRMATVQEMAAGQKLHLGAVVVVGRVHRADDGDVVDTPAQVRPPVADLNAALPARFEADLERVDPGLLLVDDVIRDLLAHVLDVGRVEDGLVRRLGDRLAGVLVQLGLGVKALEMTDPAAHHQPDHSFGPGLASERAGCVRISPRRLRSEASPPGSGRRNPYRRRTETSDEKLLGGESHVKAFVCPPANKTWFV